MGEEDDGLSTGAAGQSYWYYDTRQQKPGFA